MRTLTLDEASIFLHLPPHEILSRVETGHLPGAKINDELLFIDSDLAEYLRGYYHPTVTKAATSANLNLQTVITDKSNTLFIELVPHMLRIEENRVRRGELSQKSLSITRNRLAKWVSPYFDDMPICQIGYVTLEAVARQLSCLVQRQLSCLVDAEIFTTVFA